MSTADLSPFTVGQAKFILMGLAASLLELETVEARKLARFVGALIR
ncbi:MAG: hypothetical protein ACTSYX_01055 [Candidatus Thorarchaeota archaeon]